MAKKHVVSYYLEQEQVYLQMLGDLQELDELYRSGKMDYERYSELRDRLLPQVEELKQPYELLSYVMFLLNIPNRPKKGSKYEYQNRLYFQYLSKFAKEGEPDESSDVLANFRKLVREAIDGSK